MPPTLALPRRAVAAPRLRRPSPRLLVALLGLVVLAGGGWLWLRQSSLVAVRHVTIVGAEGPQAARIAGALQDAARDMTTLRVRQDALRTAVEPYPIVRRVDAQPDFPHGLRIVVHEYAPVGALAAAGVRVPVAADGTVLRDTPADGLPVITIRGWAPGARPRGRAAEAVAVLAAAPPALRARVRALSWGPKGWTAPLTDGPVLYLGDSHRLAAKWIAAARVLDDPTAAGATYLDLRLPDRPAAGDALMPPQPTTTTDAATGLPGVSAGTSPTSPTTPGATGP
jgi:cell division protein FtsQ